ncbi:ammonium transporter [Nocardia neocaledoniensis]|uniref:ammonium transporter n=1 Tax=Nocardia neocaledoniensis TaxID=236511 RepID=UPI002457A50D|nr:ammonium transporter [Nocardia neocaledoniensis]
MIIRKIAAAAIPILAAALVGTGVAHAEPVTPDVEFRTELIGNTVVTTLTNGTFTIDGGKVDVRDEAGATLVSLPLSVRDGALEYPLPHKLREDSRVLELTAVKDVAAARPNLTPVASPAENYAAQANFASTFGLATAIGSFVGMAIGAVIGLVVGAAAGGIGALPGFITGATVGGIIGTIVAGGPTLVVAGIDLINTLTAPPGTTRWAQQTN